MDKTNMSQASSMHIQCKAYLHVLENTPVWILIVGFRERRRKTGEPWEKPPVHGNTCIILYAQNYVVAHFTLETICNSLCFISIIIYYHTLEIWKKKYKIVPKGKIEPQ